MDLDIDIDLDLEGQVGFESWVRGELSRSPLVTQGFAALLDKAATILCRIRKSLQQDCQVAGGGVVVSAKARPARRFGSD